MNVTINVPVVYMALNLRVFRRARSITSGIGRVGPGSRDFFEPWNGYERKHFLENIQHAIKSRLQTVLPGRVCYKSIRAAPGRVCSTSACSCPGLVCCTSICAAPWVYCMLYKQLVLSSELFTSTLCSTSTCLSKKTCAAYKCFVLHL
jgi:hypothetical protein